MSREPRLGSARLPDGLPSEGRRETLAVRTRRGAVSRVLSVNCELRRSLRYGLQRLLCNKPRNIAMPGMLAAFQTTYR